MAYGVLGIPRKKGFGGFGFLEAEPEMGTQIYVPCGGCSQEREMRGAGWRRGETEAGGSPGHRLASA